MKAGFIGVGKMGGPMCRNLIRKGHEVVVHDPDAQAAARCTAEGAGEAGSPRAVAGQCEVVFTCLPYPHIVEEVALGPEGIAAGAHDGLVVADFSTNDPAIVRRIAAELEGRGVPFLDAPVAGGVPGAESATISIMVGGDKAAFQRILPLFRTMGEKIYHVGGSGGGAVFKILNNMLGFCNMAAASEAFMMVARAGFDPDTFLEVLENSSGRSGALERFRRKVLPGNFDAEFTLDLAYKDLGLALKLGEETGVPLMFPGIVKHWMMEGRAIGLGHEDLCTLMRVLEHNLQTEVRSRKG